jgi:Sec-independent protein translocase protein TatA
MLDLSPAKLLIVFIVAVILLGPNKLPQVARQLGAAWRQLSHFRERMEAEVRENMPDLPSTQDIARLARSPVALLNQLAEMPSTDADRLVADPEADDVHDNGSGGTTDLSQQTWPTDPTVADPDAPGIAAPKEGWGAGAASDSRPPLVVPDDPSMN